MLSCFLAGVAASAFAAWLAAREAASVEPIEALRSGRHPVRSARSRRLRDVGALLAGLTALALLAAPDARFGGLPSALACATIVLAHVLIMPRLIELLSCSARHVLQRVASVDVRLANENLLQEVERAAATASALMLGVAMSFAFASLVDSFTSSTMAWVDQMLPADLWITSAARMAGGHSVPMSDSLRQPLARLPGVALVERVRMVDVDLENARAKLVAMDTEALGGRARLVMVDGTEADAKRGLDAGESGHLSLDPDAPPDGTALCDTPCVSPRSLAVPCCLCRAAFSPSIPTLSSAPVSEKSSSGQIRSASITCE